MLYIYINMDTLSLIIDNFTNFTTSYNKSINIFLDESNTFDMYTYISSSVIIGFISTIAYSSMKYIYTKNKDMNKQSVLTSIKDRKIIKEGLFYESIKELNDEGDSIVKSMEKDTFYWILLRVQTGNYIDMAGTHFELHGNHIRDGGDINNSESNKCDTRNPFKTRDFYMILKITTKTRINFKNDILFGNAILRIMNYTNLFVLPKFHNTDFIVCAIATSPFIESDEIEKTMKGIEYDTANLITIPSINGNIQCVLLLPVHQVYDAFMDMYNNTIFESKKYIIDDDNYESWNGKSINEYTF